MPERKQVIEYKGFLIDYYLGSNWVYINGRPFNGMRSAKIWVNKKLKAN